MSFLLVFFFCFVTSIYFFGFGYLSNRYIYKLPITDNVIQFSFFGLFSLSFLALFANFFISLNLYFNSIIILTSIFYLFFLEKELVIKILKYSIIISIISSLTIVLDNTNRPDSGLYHLPYTSLLNENKLVVGVANLNERFGIASILQYISALNYNFIFLENGILIPLVIIYSTVIIFFFLKIFDSSESDVLKILSFLFFIFILTNMNRYSGFGNDAPANLFYFVLTYYFLKYKNDILVDTQFKILVLITVYIFLIKPFFALLFIIPLIFLISNYRDVRILSLSNIICFVVIVLWLIKNFFITGCFLYPINFTCLQTLDWSINPYLISLESEAWAKGWPDRYDKNLNYNEYLKNFYWIKVWISNHFKFITIKLLPFFLILIIISTIIIYKNNGINLIKEKKYNQLIIVNISLLSCWFMIFPAYRFGLGIIGVFISLLFINFFFKRIVLNNSLLYKSIILIIILCSSTIVFKNLNRIYNNYSLNYVDYPWPKKNSHYEKNNKLINIPVKYNGKTTHYTTPSKELCFYSKSPCTHLRNLKVRKDKYLNFYEKYTIDKR